MINSFSLFPPPLGACPLDPSISERKQPARPAVMVNTPPVVLVLEGLWRAAMSMTLLRWDLDLLALARGRVSEILLTNVLSWITILTANVIGMIDWDLLPCRRCRYPYRHRLSQLPRRVDRLGQLLRRVYPHPADHTTGFMDTAIHTLPHLPHLSRRRRSHWDRLASE